MTTNSTEARTGYKSSFVQHKTPSEDLIDYLVESKTTSRSLIENHTQMEKVLGDLQRDTRSANFASKHPNADFNELQENLNSTITTYKITDQTQQQDYLSELAHLHDTLVINEIYRDFCDPAKTDDQVAQDLQELNTHTLASFLEHLQDDTLKHPDYRKAFFQENSPSNKHLITYRDILLATQGLEHQQEINKVNDRNNWSTITTNYSSDFQGQLEKLTEKWDYIPTHTEEKAIHLSQWDSDLFAEQIDEYATERQKERQLLIDVKTQNAKTSLLFKSSTRAEYDQEIQDLEKETESHEEQYYRDRAVLNMLRFEIYKDKWVQDHCPEDNYLYEATLEWETRGKWEKGNPLANLSPEADFELRSNYIRETDFNEKRAELTTSYHWSNEELSEQKSSFCREQFKERAEGNISFQEAAQAMDNYFTTTYHPAQVELLNSFNEANRTLSWLETNQSDPNPPNRIIREMADSFLTRPDQHAQVFQELLLKKDFV